MNELALFAGAGGGILGGHLLGWRTVCAVEWEPYPASVLCARQNDGLLPPFPIWDDVQTFDGKPWRGIVDVVSGGFPCQDISAAGRGGGLKVIGQECGKRWHGLLARYDPNTHSLRTVQCSLLEDLNESLQTWPRWGLMHDGVCYQQPMLAQTTSESESGSLQRIPTPDANMGNRGTQENWQPVRPSGQPAQYPINQYLRDLTKTTGKPNPMWCEWLMGWPMGWTDLKPLEMGRSHCAQQPHGKS